MDVVRAVHLDMANHPEGIARTGIGHSVGRFEGAELVIETALFSAAAPRATGPYHWRASPLLYVKDPLVGRKLEEGKLIFIKHSVMFTYAL